MSADPETKQPTTPRVLAEDLPPLPTTEPPELDSEATETETPIFRTPGTCTYIRANLQPCGRPHSGLHGTVCPKHCINPSGFAPCEKCQKPTWARSRLCHHCSQPNRTKAYRKSLREAQAIPVLV